MDRDEYNRLVSKRDSLKELHNTATLPKHKQMIDTELSDIRGKLKDAHRELHTTRAERA